MSPVPLQSLSTLFGDGGALVFLLARVVFGAAFVVFGLNHFLNAESMSGYAGAKGVPAPSLAVPFTGGMLVFGGLAVALGVVPLYGAGAIAAFLLVTTPVMHDFWAAPEEEAQSELTNFLKNVALFGTALGFLAVSAAPWPYAL
jgi:uncharacterized membrane protein YphA (DoxX/SURF4 family)